MNETMGNQQVTQLDLVWLAAMWDAEGYFSMRRCVLKNGPQYSPRLGLVNSDTNILSKARSIADALGISYYFVERGPGSFPGSKKQVWHIEIGTMVNAIRLIDAVRPYLVAKGFQADCIAEYCNRRLAVMADRHSKTNGQKKYAERDFELVRQVFDANGNRRGTSETVRQDAQKAMSQSELSRDGKTWSEKAMRYY